MHSPCKDENEREDYQDLQPCEYETRDTPRQIYWVLQKVRRCSEHQSLEASQCRVWLWLVVGPSRQESSKNLETSSYLDIWQLVYCWVWLPRGGLYRWIWSWVYSWVERLLFIFVEVIEVLDSKLFFCWRVSAPSRWILWYILRSHCSLVAMEWRTTSAFWELVISPTSLRNAANYIYYHSRSERM